MSQALSPIRPTPPLPSLERLKSAIESAVGFKDWKSTGNVEEAKRRVFECVLTKKKILDLSGLGLSPFTPDMLKHLEFLENFICDVINDAPDRLPDYFLERDWTIIFVDESLPYCTSTFSSPSSIAF